ncbi:MAG: hypothetical protein ABH881_01325 [bacterium]
MLLLSGLLGGCASSMTAREATTLPFTLNSDSYQVFTSRLPSSLVERESRGARHRLYLEPDRHGDNEYSDEYIDGIRCYAHDAWWFVVAYKGDKINPNRKGYFGSRADDGKLYQYSVHTVGDEKQHIMTVKDYSHGFKWNNYKPLRESGRFHMAIQQGIKADIFIRQCLSEVVAINTPKPVETPAEKLASEEAKSVVEPQRESFPEEDTYRVDDDDPNLYNPYMTGSRSEFEQYEEDNGYFTAEGKKVKGRKSIIIISGPEDDPNLNNPFME